METLCGPTADWSCDGSVTPARSARAAGCSRDGPSMRDGPALSGVLGRQGCSPRVNSGSPAEPVGRARLAACGGSAVSARWASSAGPANSAGPSARDVTPAGGTDSVDFSDTWTIRISPLLDDLDRSVVEPLRVAVDGDNG